MREQYTSYDETIAFFYEAQKKYPNIFRVEVIGKTWEERDIVVVTVSKDLQTADAKPGLFYTGTIHAREWIGIELAKGFGKYILEHIDYDPVLNEALSRATLYMVPCANPDGFEFSRTHFSFWRKNRRQNADGTFGVDLNRNFNVGYAPSKNTSSNVYSGPNPFSEPETLALKNYAEDHPNITIALDYHSQGNVFFPAHNFKHEDALNATDLNTLSANMAEEIRKVSGREYGVHMGKPPVNLISGCGREFYYSQGALALTVEVGTRNISDFIENMTEHINENIPALIYALTEAPNYDKTIRLPRITNFISSKVSNNRVELIWDYPEEEDVYFEIYRSLKEISHCQASNRIGMTKAKTYTDHHLHASMNYTYFVRAVCKKRRIKSAFAPKITIRTHSDIDGFSKVLFPTKERIGYVGEKTSKNSEHFGLNSLFVGISQSRGECYGVMGFPLDSVPENAIITNARISLYPLNRVNVQVEKFGEWRIGIMDESACESLHSFTAVKNAPILSYIEKPTQSHELSQGIWRTWVFAKNERKLLQEALKRKLVTFRMDGPTRLPLDRSSQLMQWDIGFNKYSNGLEFRPKLEISYTLSGTTIELESSGLTTISECGNEDNTLQVGFDKKGCVQYGCIEFNLDNLPNVENTVFSSIYLEMDAVQVNASQNIRFHVEMIASQGEEKSVENILKRQSIERIGYEVSIEEINKEKTQRFVFDTYSIVELISSMRRNQKLLFVVLPTSEKNFSTSQLVDWTDSKNMRPPCLKIEYVKKRREGVEGVTDLKFVKDNGQIKLSWKNPDDEAFKGVIVVKNSFHIPCSPYDGQKLYGGKDSYTYDNFGALDESKYYAVFTYDDVPNFSQASSVFYRVD
ncbi:MAG: peptidase [Arcobacter sp.]|nr:MAG: peptidase [Arcobacter sp.]